MSVQSLRIVFLGTPAFAIPALERLLNSDHDVVAVYTQPDRPVGRNRVLSPSPVKQLAQSTGILVFQPPRLRSPAEVEGLAALHPELIVVAAYGQILPKAVLDIPPLGCLNLHPSLLPKHRGPAPVADAILAGNAETGTTIMLMDEGMDTGPIIAQSRLSIEADDTTASLTERLAHLSADLLVTTIPLWQEGQITPQPQDEKAASYSHLLSKSEGEMDWNLPAQELWRRVRAFHPWPGCFTHLRGKTLKVLEAVPFPELAASQPGKVVALDSAETPLGVETGKGVLGLKRLQLEGKLALPASEFLRGQPGILGMILPS